MHTDPNTKLVSNGVIQLKYDPRFSGIGMEIHHVTVYLQEGEVEELLEKLYGLGEQHFSPAWGAKVRNIMREKEGSTHAQ